MLLGGSRLLLGPSLGDPWGLLEAPWGRVPAKGPGVFLQNAGTRPDLLQEHAATLASRSLGEPLRTPGGRLGPPWELLGDSLGSLGRSLDALGCSLEPLGCSLGAP